MTSPSLEQLKGSLAIDKSVLDDEVIRQPMLFYAVSEQLTEALAERDAAKEWLATEDASLGVQWRAKLEKAKIRATEAIVTSHVQTDPRHTKAFDEWLEAKTKADRFLVLKDAFIQRSYMLRDLVALYSANYFEASSMKPTKMQEASQYANNRARISSAREARGK